MEGDRRYDGGAASPASVSSVSKAAERDVEVEDEVAAGVAEGEEAESDRDDEGLELGLTLGAAGKWNPPPVPWSPCLRILTAKDLPSLASLAPPRSPSASSVSSSSVTNLRGGGTGTKRSDEPASPDFGGSPQPPSQMVVGWPPIRAFRMNSLFNQSKEHTPETAAVAIKKSVSKDQNRKDQGGRRTEMRSSMFVKVKMDGDPIGRKVDLNAHHSYEALAVSLELMFQKPTMATNLLASFVDSDGAMSLKSLDSSSEFALTYEDKDGDWMLVGDVPWGTKTYLMRRRVNEVPRNHIEALCEGEKEHIEEERVNIIEGEATDRVFFGLWIIGIVIFSLQNQTMKITLFC